MRLFLAINLPDEIKKKLSELQKELPEDGLRKVLPENIHLTLRFLGNVSDMELPKIIRPLNTLSFEPFTMKIKGVGVFPNQDYIRAVWTGCESTELFSLEKQISTILKGKEDQEFSPHITLSRVRKRINIPSFLEKYGDVEIGEFTVSKVDLMQSFLKKGLPPKYEIITSFPER